MNKKLIETGRGVFVFFLYTLNTLFWGPIILFLGILRFISPFTSFAHLCSKGIEKIPTLWMAFNSKTMDLFYPANIIVTGDPIPTNLNAWYLVISNHQSWVDILILQRLFSGKIPYFKCFLKQELFWFPILGLVWWTLGFVYLKRHTQAEIAKNPALKEQDLEATKKACEQFKVFPSSIFSFVEGTRYTKEKSDHQKSPYTHLLRPKAGGISLVLDALKDHIKEIIDVTIAYPEGIKGFWDFICGRISLIRVHIKTIPVTNVLIGDYAHDPVFKHNFQEWLNNLWAEKALLLNSQKSDEL